MNLDCLNDIITDGLAIHIDASDLNSWNLNTGLTSISLSKWSGAESDNINLYDFGLTAYDNGRVDDAKSNIILTPDDVLLTLHRVGYNNATGGTFYDIYPMSGVTTGTSIGNYFELDGGYLQGFFKLQNQNYEVLPARFGEGITIENILRIDSGSSGIFYYMGTRAEDKYNSFFSGETVKIETTEIVGVSTGVGRGQATVVEEVIEFSGVTTSNLNYLNAFLDETVQKNAFMEFENQTNIVPTEQPKDATYDNVIAFELTQDKRIVIKKIDANGLVNIKTSPNIVSSTGWTIITQVFTPDTIITDPAELECLPRRIGTLTFYVNGRKFWELDDYSEYYFVDIKNDSDKVIGVPYNISWGGGSFGLKHSWHYDINRVTIYSGGSQIYIDDNFTLIDNPIDDDICGLVPPIITGATGNSLILLENNTTFSISGLCDPMIETPITVMEATYSGATGSSLNQYFIRFDTQLNLISNRDYDFSVNIYDMGIFNYDDSLEVIRNSISLVVYSTGTTGTTDVNLIKEITYKNPVSIRDVLDNAPFSTLDGDVFQYLDGETNLLIDGQTGFPVTNGSNADIIQVASESNVVTGANKWNTLKLKIETEPNSGENIFYVGILIESSSPINEDGKLFIDEFKYQGSDILNQDTSKNGLLVEQNFNNSYKGGIQKLRVYDVAFDSQMVMHNARIESINNPNYGKTIRRGGRLIYR